MKSKNHLRVFLILHLLIYAIYNLGHPVTPEYIKEINAPMYMTGVLLGVMALAQFSFAPLWGQISDVFGRKIAYIGPLGYVIGQLGFVFLSTPSLLIFFRFFSGAFAIITTTVHFAYISDKAKPKEVSKYLGYASLLLPIGVFLGYTVGGYLGDIISPRMTFLVQAIASLILAIILYFFIDSPSKEGASLKKIKWNILKEDFQILKRNNDTPLKYILAITFLNIISFQLTISQAAVILSNGFDKTTSFVGLYVALFNLFAGLLSFIVQAKVVAKTKRKAKILPYLSLFSIVCSIIILIGVNISLELMWIGMMMSTILNTAFIALIQDIITKIDKHNEKGALIGLNQAVQSLGVFCGTFSAGMLVSNNIAYPMMMGALLFVLTLLLNVKVNPHFKNI
ncbi:MAG: MFS transporter [Erysipelotrichales bacterium]